jgi:hypothetical protein
MRLLGVVSSFLILAGPAARPLRPDFAVDPVWDDGKAEIARYVASRTVYGERRPYEAILLAVKEDLDAASLVKADPPYGARPLRTVLKLNLVREIPTANYDYRYLTSVFVDRSDPTRLVKLTSSSQEWCGNTFKAVRVGGGRAVYRWSSYFDGEADGEQELALGPDDLFEDQLPLSLRGLDFGEGRELRVRLFPSFATNRAGPLRPLASRLEVSGPEALQVPAGSFRAWKVAGEAAGLPIALWFDAAPPHLLLRWETTLGDRLELSSVERRAYWAERPR